MRAFIVQIKLGIIAVLLLMLTAFLHAQPEPPGVWDWDVSPAGYLNNLTAAVGFGPEWVVFISGQEVMYYSLTEEEDVPPMPLTAIAGWPAGWTNGIDAAVKWDEDTNLLFYGNRYLLYDLPTDSITGEEVWSTWPRVWNNKIDAAVRWDISRILFFKGDQYVLYDMLRKETTEPESILQWTGWHKEWLQVDAILNPGYGTVYFFRNGRYLPYVLDAQSFVAGYPKN